MNSMFSLSYHFKVCKWQYRGWKKPWTESSKTMASFRGEFREGYFSLLCDSKELSLLIGSSLSCHHKVTGMQISLLTLTRYDVNFALMYVRILFLKALWDQWPESLFSLINIFEFFSSLL